MKTYDLEAIYKVVKVITVDVEDGDDPYDESCWKDIIYEQDVDCYLWDVSRGTAVEVEND